MKDSRRRRIAALCLALVLLCLAACQSGQEEIYSKYIEDSSQPAPSGVQPETSQAAESEPERRKPKKDLSGELTISELYDPGVSGAGTAGVVAAFQAAYPNVKITVDYAIPAGEQVTEEAITAYSQRMVTELMSGNSTDIISHYGGTPSPKNISENGYALNLYERMDNDPDFYREDYFTNIFQAMEFKGKLYQMPVLFYANVVFLNSYITSALGYTFQPWDEIGYDEIVAIYRKAEEKGLLAPGFTMEYMDYRSGGALFQEAAMPDFFDEQAKEVRFDSPEFIQYLTDTKPLPSNRSLGEGIMGMGGGQAIQMFAQSNISGNTSLMFSTAMQMSDFPEISKSVEGTTPPLFLTSKGGKRVFACTLQYMIPSSCKNPDLAWEFLKFAVARVEEPGYYTLLDGVDFLNGNFPLERENFYAYSKLYAQADAASRKSPEKWMEKFDKEKAECPLDDAFFQQAGQAIEKLNTETILPVPLAQVLQPILVQYYDTDTLTPEECARQMQERAEIYLAE